MSELLPVSQAEALRSTLLEYLGTTFSLADPATRAALEEFLSNPGDGLFRGPFLRLRLPFRAADEGWRSHLEWYGSKYAPYGHQAAAFARLSSLDPTTGGLRRPLPTLVTTGTGSGKTEAFLYPILDHVLRAKRAGITGVKALILYPMNALANDQAKRLAELLTSDPALAGVTAAIYTGQKGPERTKVSAEGLINKREVIRDNPPDILLTNYKMLDQLLLRQSDSKLWSASADSLQYLVLDEFHTYDGAQGTDVAMLIRRLGLTLESYRAKPAHAHPTRDKNVLGDITPVATSATLGGKGDPDAMLDFARTVFGETFDDDAVITESSLTACEWIGDDADFARSRGLRPIDQDKIAAAHLVRDVSDATGFDQDENTRLVVEHLYRVPPSGAQVDDVPVDSWNMPDLTGYSLEELHTLLKGHPLIARLIAQTREAVPFASLVARNESEEYLTAVVNALSHLRSRLGRVALNVEVQFWVRELTRVGRIVSGNPEFFWEDDGVRSGAMFDPQGGLVTPELAFPAIYCRHCGRSGWMAALAPTGPDLDINETSIRYRHLLHEDRIRPLIHAPREESALLAELSTRPEATGHPNLGWLDVTDQRLLTKRPGSDDEGKNVIPVLMHSIGDGGKEAKDDQCPSCGEDDGIRFLGSAIATLLSVTLSGLFGKPELDAAEKKALVFTDSVQDAAHRAGFVQSRSHALTLRTLMRQAMEASPQRLSARYAGDPEAEPVDLETLVRQILDAAGNDAYARYRLLPPELAERERFAEYWQKPNRNDSRVRNRIAQRLALDVQMELGLRSTVGRTLERTGSVVAQVDAPDADLLRAAKDALNNLEQGFFEGTGWSDEALIAWVRGVLEHMRWRGAISHKWFDRFRKADGNRWFITGGRRRQDGMPGFGTGTSAPSFPRIGGTPRKDSDLEPVTAPRGWYSSWTRRCLGIDSADAGSLNKLLFAALAKADVIGEMHTESGGVTYHIEPSHIFVAPASGGDLEAGLLSLECDACGSAWPVTKAVGEQLAGGPCLAAYCEGRLHSHRLSSDDFYRQMYADADPARVVAREHTSMLEDAVRLKYETEFKASNPPPDAPNVLVATPTLEMGIDIGDLSTVMLASLPRSVASYLQRVGRAGRLTGNSLILAYVTARGNQLPRFKNPQEVINGQVRPPATYLDAEEILRRQYLASIADILARNRAVEAPRRVPDVLASAEPGTWLGALIDEAELHAEERLNDFIAGFGDEIAPAVAERLREWATRRDPEVRATSELAQRCIEAVQAWSDRLATLEFRLADIQGRIPDLEAKAASPANQDDGEAQQALRTARAALRLTEQQIGDLRGEWWIAALEAFGLLPNYTLLDDSVELDVSLSWIDPETSEFRDEQMTLQRGSAAALRDFAPGATFYARGYAIEIDALDLGRGEESIRTWACCADCGYTIDITDDPSSLPSKCPRCGSATVTDIGQQLKAVTLKRVSSVIRREEATIDDHSDERRENRFDIVTLPDIDANKAESWFVEDYGFGARYLRQMPIRWINLGKINDHGQSVMLNGVENDASLFRVCERCGKLDKATGRNDARDHRPWCPIRNKTREQTIAVALARTLNTEGLVLRIPATITTGSMFAMPSLQAALLLALRERMGGSPDHLAVESVVDPAPEQSSPALLLYDTIPGGTGYLSELASPEKTWVLLHRAWEVLRDCPCQDTGVLACEQCLLPFAPPHLVEQVSREEAERALREILLGGVGGSDDGVPGEMPWAITSIQPAATDPETILEREFRAVLKKRLETMGAKITEQPSTFGTAWTFRLAGRNWRLEPQVDIGGTRPDFLLFTEDPQIPRTAIYTDGWRFHAHQSANRLADDAIKRAALRQHGYQVFAFTWDDIDPVHEYASPPWLSPDSINAVMAESGSELDMATTGLVDKPAIESLLAWIDNPNEDSRASLAKWLPGLLFGRATGNALIPADADLAAVTAQWLENPDSTAVPVGDAPVAFWHSGDLAVGMRLLANGTFEMAVVLDDDAAALGTNHKTSWTEWLRLSNLSAMRNAIPTTITTTSLIGEKSPADTQPSAVEQVLHDLQTTEEMQALLDIAQDSEKPVIIDIIRAALPLPELGWELANGEIIIDIAWPSKHIAWNLNLDEAAQAWLTDNGWTVLDNIAALETALAA